MSAAYIYISHIYTCLCVFILSADLEAWNKGVIYAEGQNLARLLMEAPANHITPTAFANTIEEKLALHAERVTINKRLMLQLFSLRTSPVLQCNLTSASRKYVGQEFAA